MRLICGPCGAGQHHKCNGFLRTEHAFCPCSDRQHRSLDSEHDPIVKARNEAILLAHVENTLHGGEA